MDEISSLTCLISSGIQGSHTFLHFFAHYCVLEKTWLPMWYGPVSSGDVQKTFILSQPLLVGNFGLIFFPTIFSAIFQNCDKHEQNNQIDVQELFFYSGGVSFPKKPSLHPYVYLTSSSGPQWSPHKSTGWHSRSQSGLCVETTQQRERVFI